MRKVHLYVGELGGGRYAITACRDPGVYRAVIDTTEDWDRVTCKVCRYRMERPINKDAKWVTMKYWKPKTLSGEVGIIEGDVRFIEST